jgi:hypothetical protein
MNDLVYIVIIATSIWVLIDSKTIGAKKGLIKGIFDLGPFGWFVVTLLLWIVGFPAYLANRSKIKQLAKIS